MCNENVTKQYKIHLINCPSVITYDNHKICQKKPSIKSTAPQNASTNRLIILNTAIKINTLYHRDASVNWTIKINSELFLLFSYNEFIDHSLEQVTAIDYCLKEFLSFVAHLLQLYVLLPHPLPDVTHQLLLGFP